MTLPSKTDAPPAAPSRRAFCAASCRGASALLLSRSGLLRAASLAAQPNPPETAIRPDVATIDQERILSTAQHYLTQLPTPLTSLPCARSPGSPHDYYSEADPSSLAEGNPPANTGSSSKPGAPPPPFTAHRDALFALGLAVPALASAHLLTGDPHYAEHAALWLRDWFVDPATRMTPRLDYGQAIAGQLASSSYGGGRFEGILETLPLVEVAQSIPFLASALSPSDRLALNAWFADYLRWLTEEQDSGPRLPALARDRKDHHGTSWLLQASAYTLLTTPAGDAPKSETSPLDELRHRFRTVTLRAQIAEDGSFPHELTSTTPFRDSLFNLDMMALVCQLLSTRFDSVWEYELNDGPGMRSAIAYHFPFMADRSLWPFRADAQHFEQLPTRRVSLLLSARAYRRPEYAALWKTLPPDPAQPDILRTLPIHQPLLWVRQPPPAA
ncbi:MAG: alginate lyase family protein [Acidobacteriaceae bacterium]